MKRIVFVAWLFSCCCLFAGWLIVFCKIDPLNIPWNNKPGHWLKYSFIIFEYISPSSCISDCWSQRNCITGQHSRLPLPPFLVSQLLWFQFYSVVSVSQVFVVIFPVTVRIHPRCRLEWIEFFLCVCGLILSCFIWCSHLAFTYTFYMQSVCMINHKFYCRRSFYRTHYWVTYEILS